jgi:hypothetical protein
MYRRSLLVLVAWLFLGGPAAVADEAALPAPLAPFEAEYRLGNGTISVGTATFSLQRSSGLWRYRSEVRVDGLFSMFVDGPLRDTTWLDARDGKLRPVIYRHEKGDENLRVVFNWPGGNARVAAADGDNHRIELEPDSRDQFSAILAVMCALATGERTLTFSGIDDDGKAEPLRFEVTGEEQVSVPRGRYDTVRVQRTHDDGRATITWLAPELGWLPVRVEQREDGELVGRLELSSLNGEIGSAT